MKERDGVQTLTADERILAMHHLRQGLRSLYGIRYSKEVDLRIALIRKVMAQIHCAPGDAASYIIRHANKKDDPFLWAAAMEIVDQDIRTIPLN